MSNSNLHCTVHLPRNSRFVLNEDGVWYSETYIGGEEHDRWYLTLEDAEESFSAALASVRLLLELRDPGGDPGRAAVEAGSDSDPTLPGVTQLPPPASSSCPCA